MAKTQAGWPVIDYHEQELATHGLTITKKTRDEWQGRNRAAAEYRAKQQQAGQEYEARKNSRSRSRGRGR